MTLEEFQLQFANKGQEISELNKQRTEIESKIYHAELEQKEIVHQFAAEMADHKIGEEVNVERNETWQKLHGVYKICDIRGTYSTYAKSFVHWYVGHEKIKSGWSRKETMFSENDIVL